MTFRGCENGLSGYPNTSTHVAPNEPSTSGVLSDEVSSATVVMARNPPNHVIAMVFNGARAGAMPPPRIFSMYLDNAFVEAWCVGACAMASAALFICQMFSVRGARFSVAHTPPAGSYTARHGRLRKGVPDPSGEVTSPGGQNSGYRQGRVGWRVPEMYLAVPCSAYGCDGQRSEKPRQASLSAHLAP